MHDHVDLARIMSSPTILSCLCTLLKGLGRPIAGAVCLRICALGVSHPAHTTIQFIQPRGLRPSLVLVTTPRAHAQQGVKQSVLRLSSVVATKIASSGLVGV